MKLTKLDAAERQLRQAIRLFFSEADEVSTHTLACAAHGVLNDLAKAKGTPRPLHDQLPTYVRRDRVKEVRALLKAPQNFFKHADEDPDRTLDFSPDLTPFLLFDACVTHSQLAAYFLMESFALMTWFYLKNPDILLDGPVKDLLAGPGGLLDDVDAGRRDSFLYFIDRMSRTQPRIPIAGRTSAV